MDDCHRTRSKTLLPVLLQDLTNLQDPGRHLIWFQDLTRLRDQHLKDPIRLQEDLGGPTKARVRLQLLEPNSEVVRMMWNHPARLQSIADQFNQLDRLHNTSHR